MYNKNDAVASLKDFHKFSAHAVNEFFGGNVHILPTENQANELEKILDFAGIDGFIVTRDGTAYPYASRVQKTKVNYQSFSLRGYRPSGTATEFAKLKKARKTGAAMPTFTIQAFVDADEKAATVAVAYTIELVRYVETHDAEKRRTATGEEFFVVPWRELTSVRIYRVSDNGNAADVTADFSATA